MIFVAEKEKVGRRRPNLYYYLESQSGEDKERKGAG